MTFAQKLFGALKGLIIAYIITMLLLFVIAVVVYKAGIGDTALNLLVIAVYVTATFAGGCITGHCVKERRFAWGMAFGVMYILVSLILSALLGDSGDTSWVSCAARSVMCVAGGMLGAMLSR